MELLARIETRLERDREVLRPRLSHYGLVFPVEPAVLHAFMQQIRVHGEADQLVLGTASSLELHGGGVLRLLFDSWRPDGRSARPSDRYPFPGSPQPPTLGALYAAGRSRLTLPPSAGLPRMRSRFALPGGPVREVETDAYQLLDLATRLEPDVRQRWENALGESLSVELLMGRVRESYLQGPGFRAEPEDHAELHLVELLVAYADRDPSLDLAAVQRHFLDVELAPRSFDADRALLLGHSAESLGRLLRVSTLRWEEPDRARVTRWLGELAGSVDVERDDLDALCHLASGLRSVRKHRAQLE
jgi:hypothetical protein